MDDFDAASSFSPAELLEEVYRLLKKAEAQRASAEFAARCRELQEARERLYKDDAYMREALGLD